MEMTTDADNIAGKEKESDSALPTFVYDGSEGDPIAQGEVEARSGTQVNVPLVRCWTPRTMITIKFRRWNSRKVRVRSLWITRPP